MNIVCIIPARIGSTRLAKKPLRLLRGKPIIQHTFEAAMRCKVFSQVVVATDDQSIATLIQAVGGVSAAKMVKGDYATGTDRVATVARHYPKADVVVNLQGDEPFVQPAMLEALVAPYSDSRTLDMTTLACPINWSVDYGNPDCVKVICDKHYNALYFSRAPIPYLHGSLVPNAYTNFVFHHIGIYAFRSDFLQQYACLKQTPLELTESLEQLRVLENDYKIRVCPVKSKTQEINTSEDLMKAERSFEMLENII